MKNLSAILLLIASLSFAQNEPLKVGDKAPAFLLSLKNNGTQGFTMPYLNQVVLIHFYSTSVHKSMFYNKPFNRLAKRYKNSIYRSCDGFEAVEIAVQSDKNEWMSYIDQDTLDCVINGIATRGYNDLVCKKFGINHLPTDLLIDENGEIVAVNPKITEIEDFLDSKKSYLPIKKDVVGTLAYASNKNDVFRYSKLYLFNAYGDSIARTTTSETGKFSFSDIKLNQDFILKVDNGVDIVLADPVAIFNENGEKVIEGKSFENGFVFYIPSNQSFKLTSLSDEHMMEGKVNQIDVNKHLRFAKNNSELTKEDIHNLNSIVDILNKNEELKTDIIAHSSTKLDNKAAEVASEKQVILVKEYLIKKGISPERITTSFKGNSEPINDCLPPQTCSDSEHAENQRIEFRFYKN